ncbi:hypothetical protein AZH53_09530 [Methanomicrobiaceae archaeon CYW5]|uniref:hypothetical protein n=1 Tax=Methanovulcanius yangii TaxID=1789227 RepID=UPI0029CA80AA|nr:hypothetical protein [Methanovulcanius yangii]MBT8508644.1 hypothetical protein [Methanovulcanius yangii]
MTGQEGGYFTLDDFDWFTHFVVRHPRERDQYEQHFEDFIAEKVRPLHRTLKDTLGSRTSRVGYDRRDFEYVHLAFFDAPEEELATFLNIFIGRHGIHILANTEYPTSVARFERNMAADPAGFDACIAALPPDVRFTSRLYTKIPLHPYGWDEYFFQLVVKYVREQTTAAALTGQIERFRSGFAKAIRKGLVTMEIDPRYGTDGTEYYRSFYEGPAAQMAPDPDAFLALRFYYVIPLGAVIRMDEETLAGEIAACADRLRPLIAFGNR